MPDANHVGFAIPQMKRALLMRIGPPCRRGCPATAATKSARGILATSSCRRADLSMEVRRWRDKRRSRGGWRREVDRRVVSDVERNLNEVKRRGKRIMDAWDDDGAFGAWEVSSRGVRSSYGSPEQEQWKRGGVPVLLESTSAWIFGGPIRTPQGRKGGKCQSETETR